MTDQPSTQLCTCGATDGQCHGYEGGAWWPQPYETATTIFLKLGTTIEYVWPRDD